MRITQEEKEYIIQNFKKYFDTGRLYLFGSRMDDTKKGGDLDLFVDYNAKKHKTIKSTKYVIKDYPLLYPYFWSSREEPIKASNIVYKIINEERVDCFGFLVREFGIKELEKFYKKEFLTHNERRKLFEMFISYWR